MNDLETMLRKAGRVEGPTDSATVDADVARGHRALTRRRMRRAGTRSVLVGALAIGSFALVHNGSGHGTTVAVPLLTTTMTGPAVATQGTPTKPLAIRLVAYTGSQPQGYTVDSVPSGWAIQGVDNYNLDIAPIGFSDQSLNDFVGKIVVMLQSKDAKPLTAADGDTVAVGSGTGIVSNVDRQDGLQLNYKDAASGKWVMIQAPLSLNWTDAELGQFAAAVHVNASAEAGVG